MTNMSIIRVLKPLKYQIKIQCIELVANKFHRRVLTKTEQVPDSSTQNPGSKDGGFYFYE
jgi:hypothetical protein